MERPNTSWPHCVRSTDLTDQVRECIFKCIPSNPCFEPGKRLLLLAVMCNCWECGIYHGGCVGDCCPLGRLTNSLLDSTFNWYKSYRASCLCKQDISVTKSSPVRDLKVAHIWIIYLLFINFAHPGWPVERTKFSLRNLPPNYLYLPHQPDYSSSTCCTSHRGQYPSFAASRGSRPLLHR